MPARAGSGVGDVVESAAGALDEGGAAGAADGVVDGLGGVRGPAEAEHDHVTAAVVWTVCETDPPAGTSGGGKVRLIIDRSCADTASSDSSAASSGTSEPEVQEQTPEPTAEPTPKPKKKKRPKPAAITVPAVVGMDHQAAQNRMQAAGLYNLRERDATGEGRLMIWDRNWVVVRQSPAPGSAATE